MMDSVEKISNQNEIKKIEVVKDEKKESKNNKDVKKSHHSSSSKSSSSEKHRDSKKDVHKHHSHRKRSSSRDRYQERSNSRDRHRERHKDKKSRRSSSSSSRSRSRSVSRHKSSSSSHKKSQRRSRSREEYRRNDYEKRCDYKKNEPPKRTINHDGISKPKPEIKIETKTENENSTDNKMVDLLKQIEVPKDLRFNRQEAAKYQMEQLRKKTEELTGVKVPSFYNTTAINPLVYAEQQKKRKLLWSKAKDNENTSTGIVGRAIVEGQDEKTAEKFRKLMGIKSSTNDTQNNSTLSSSSSAAEIDQIHKMQAKAFEAMDKEYQFARMASHTHRGMGLGFATNPVVIDPNTIQRAAQLNK